MFFSKLCASYFLLFPGHVSNFVPGNGQGYHRCGGAGGWYSRKNYCKHSPGRARAYLTPSRSHPTVLRVYLSDSPSLLLVRKVMTSRVPTLLPPRLQSLNPSQQKLKRRNRNPRRRPGRSPNPPPPLPRSNFPPGTSSLPPPLPRRLPLNAVFLSRRSRVPVPTEGSSGRMLRSSSPLQRAPACQLPSQPPALLNTPTFL